MLCSLSVPSQFLVTLRTAKMVVTAQPLFSMMLLGRKCGMHLGVTKSIVLCNKTVRVQDDCLAKNHVESTVATVSHYCLPADVYSRAFAPDIISTSSVVIFAWRARLYRSVSEDIISPAFDDALSIALIRALCSEAILSSIHP